MSTCGSQTGVSDGVGCGEFSGKVDLWNADWVATCKGGVKMSVNRKYVAWGLF